MGAVANQAPNMQFQTAVLLSLLLIGTCRIKGDGVDEKYEYSPYHYEYKVHDDKEYLDFGQEEEVDEHGNVHGYYHVQLPDGRHQRVDYHVDGYSGFIADVKYDGKASHPAHHSSGHHGHHGHHGHGGRFGKSLDLSTQSGTPHKISSHFGGQGKSLNFADDLRNSESQLEPKLQQSFGEGDRKGKALTFKSKTIEISKQEEKPFVRPVDTFHDAGHFSGFGRQGKSLNSDGESRFGFGSSSDDFGSDFGSFQSSLRKGKSLDENVKSKKKKSNLITRRRIERAGVLDSTLTEKKDAVVLKTTTVEKKDQLNKKPTFQQKIKEPKVQNTFFQYVPKNIKSPFSSNFYEELVLKSEEEKHEKEKKETEAKISDIPISTRGSQQLESKPQTELLTGIYDEKPIKQENENEIESEESRLPAIRGKILYGP